MSRVFLRPDEWHRPIDYIKSLEKSGLMVLPQQNLALMTCKTGPNVGPTGPQGDPGADGADGIDQNSWYDTIICACSDEVTPINVSVTRKVAFRTPYPLDLTTGYIRISLSDATVGAAFIIDAHMNDVSVFTTPLQIDDGMDTSVGSSVPAILNIAYVPDDAKWEVFVTQVGSSSSGTGLKFAITGIKTT